ncbi:MAG TPA: AMP-binding protein, partial [Candidatus Sulfotelmatobacter sp.]|nr:AMP-binding protein [Candidatus Sulfotelmatobacter sp.]
MVPDRLAAWPVFGRDAPDVAWRPGPGDLADTRLARFLRSTGHADLTELQRHAEADPGWFWGAAAGDLAIPWQRRPRATLDLADGPEFARWWTGGAFNYAAAAVEPRAGRAPDGPALAWEGDDGEVRRLTNLELQEAVERAAAMLQARGVRAGDRVGILLPLLPETVVAVLALGLIEAIYTPIFSGYGAPAVAARLRDAEASVLITADGFLRRGAVVRLKETADAAVADVPSVRQVLVVRRLGARGGSVPWTPGRDAWWHEALADAPVRRQGPATVTDPETPYMLIYTS